MSLNIPIDGVSLLVATLGEHDIRPLLDSLETQSCDKYECIVIDQSDEKIVERVVSGYKNIKYLHSLRKGNSFNRNIGIKHAQMPILAFPDDDCFYNSDVIEKVLECFNVHPDIAGISGSWMDSITGNLVMGGGRNKYANNFNLWTSVTNLTIFVRSEVVKKVNGYNEKFGLGSNIFEGGEETDFILKILKERGKVLYTPNIRIWHKQENYTLINPSKQWGYEESWGALFRKWSFSDKKGVIVFLKFLLVLFKSFMGAFYWTCLGNFSNARLYLRKNRARLHGWIKYRYFKRSLRNKG